MISVRLGLIGASLWLIALLAATTAVAALGPLPTAVGLTCGAGLCVAVAGGAAATGTSVLGPADLVTLTRATMTCGIAALVAQPMAERTTEPALVGLATAALLLDAVDGQVARRTSTASAFGARFDGEVDAFLILVLSVHVAPATGVWVLGIGGARYAFALAGAAAPWLRAQLPPRYWRKVVAAVQGMALTGAAAGVAPASVVLLALTVALALLTESFGRDVLWLWRHRRGASPTDSPLTTPVAVRLR